MTIVGSNGHASVEKVRTDLTEIGSTGLREFGGVLAEEFSLRGS
jgi:hypothetical protein